MPSHKEMEAAGFAPEDYEHPPVDIWPENWDAVRFFRRLYTQWRYGMNGRTGLDYTAVLAMLRSYRYPQKKADEIFAAVQIMELAALAEMHRK